MCWCELRHARCATVAAQSSRTEVNMISFASAPRSSATCLRAVSTASSLCQPYRCVRLCGLPYCSSMNGIMASNTRGSSGVVAWAQQTRQRQGRRSGKTLAPPPCPHAPACQSTAACPAERCLSPPFRWRRLQLGRHALLRCCWPTASAQHVEDTRAVCVARALSCRACGECCDASVEAE